MLFEKRFLRPCMYVVADSDLLLLRLGKSRLRDLFLKVDNDIGGKFYGQIIKVCLKR